MIANLRFLTNGTSVDTIRSDYDYESRN
jgi:hypothetical protein